MEGVGVNKEYVTGSEKEYEVVEELKVKYPVNFLCEIMGINRSGYYKWKQRQGKENRYEKIGFC